MATWRKRAGHRTVGSVNKPANNHQSYSIGDIVDTLVDFCKFNSFDPKRTYVWICCLCVNQHRVAELEQSGMLIATDDFFMEFGRRVTGIGHLLSMMAPWKDPSNLKRVWCIFELGCAVMMGCTVTIVMPPGQKEARNGICSAMTVTWTPCMMLWPKQKCKMLKRLSKEIGLPF